MAMELLLFAEFCWVLIGPSHKSQNALVSYLHDDVIKWKHFPRYWPFVRGIHRSRWIPLTKASDAELWCFLWSGHLCGEFTGPDEFPSQRPVMRSFDVFFDLRLNKRLSKQWWGWWFETLSRPLWRNRNVTMHHFVTEMCTCVYISVTKWCIIG